MQVSETPKVFDTTNFQTDYFVNKFFDKIVIQPLWFVQIFEPDRWAAPNLSCSQLFSFQDFHIKIHLQQPKILFHSMQAQFQQ